MIRIIALAGALLLGGCGGSLPPISDIFKAANAATVTIENPVDDVDIYRVKNAYAAALEVAAEYRRYCWARPYAVLLVDPVSKPVCERRRAVVRAFQSAQAKAKMAIDMADRFVVENPTINAISVVRAAWDAVQQFRAVVPGADGSTVRG